jgi:hypothetical protein
MENNSYSFKQAFNEVSASSAGGAPFLISYGATFLITAILSLFLPRPTAALVAMFQGGAALPLAFWLERKMSTMRMSRANPLNPLSAQMAMSQALSLPVLIIVYTLNPGAIPVTLAGIGGMHFLPYTWLHRTRIYTILALTIALGTFVLQIILGAQAFSVNLFFIALVYMGTVPLVYRHAKRVVTAAPA